VSDFDFNGDDFGAEYGQQDENYAYWQDAFARDEITAQAELARAAAAEQMAQYQGVDRQAAALDAAAMLRIAAEQEAINAAGERHGQILDNSMTAMYKDEWVQHRGAVGNRLAADEAFANAINADDLQGAADRAEQIFFDIRDRADTSKAEWEMVRKAGDTDYATIRARQEAIRDVQGGNR
jgi:hypothetical protein